MSTDELLNNLTGEVNDANLKEKLAKALKEINFSKRKTMQEVLDNGLASFFKKELPQDIASKMCEIMLRQQDYIYAQNAWRRSYRTSNIQPYYEKITKLMRESICFDWSKFGLVQYLKMGEKEIAAKDYKVPENLLLTNLIALELDHGNNKVIEAVEDIILAENNTIIIDYPLIRSIAMSKNEKLHQLMKKLLLATKLQEGLRQAILETADEGTREYFILMLETVLENNLLRFSSGIRAANVWMGLSYYAEDRRVVEKLLKLGLEYLKNESSRKKALESSDTTEIYAAMWAESVFDLNNVRIYIEKYMGQEKYKKLIAMYMLYQTEEDAAKIRFAANYLNETDLDVICCVMWNYNLFLNWGAKSEEAYIKNYKNNKNVQFLKDKKIRDTHFDSLYRIIKLIPQQGHQVQKKPFEWSDATLTREVVFNNMFAIAAWEHDEMKNQRLMELFPYTNSNIKMGLLRYMIDPVQSQTDREFLFSCLSNKSMETKIEAAKIIKKLILTDIESKYVENLLALKTGEIRQIALEILEDRSPADIVSSVRELISSKTENKRLGALDMLASLAKKGAISKKEIAELTGLIPQATEQEKIIINDLTDKQAAIYNEENGFGLYDPNYRAKLAAINAAENPKYTLAAFKGISCHNMESVLESLIEVIKQHKDYSFKLKAWESEKDELLGNLEYLTVPAHLYKKYTREYCVDDYVLADVWRKWVKDNNISLLTLVKIRYCYTHSTYFRGLRSASYSCDYLKWATKLITSSFGYAEINDFIKGCAKREFGMLAASIASVMADDFAEEEIFSLYYGILADFWQTADKKCWSQFIEKEREYGYLSRSLYKLAQAAEIVFFLHKILNVKDDKLFSKGFNLCYDIAELSGEFYDAFTEEHIARALTLGLTAKDDLYRIFLTQYPDSKMRRYTGYNNYYYADHVEKAIKSYPVLLEVAHNIMNRVLEIELKRGDTPTLVSKIAMEIKKHHGAETFAEIIVALGNETLVRGYNYTRIYTKKEVLSSLLKACSPAEGDDFKKLKKALGGRVTDKRLLEAAMYAPSWIAIVEKYLGWPGLKSAAWYFHAHTNNSFSSEFETEVARFSPIAKEDFQDGAFDIAWFKDAYQTIGEERFNILYDCAKYISDGASHRRAQLFADAVLGKLDAGELKNDIITKRNKDKLLSFSLMPFKKDKMVDALERYEFIQRFLKESKQFGAQRRVSEAKVCQIALENLARNLGFADSLRFSWKMELLKIDKIKGYFKPCLVEDAETYLEIDATGAAEIVVVKNGNPLKSIPGKLKKHPYIEELKSVKNSLKEQFARARTSLEKAMENSDEFSYGEIADLKTHPVINPLLTNLVFKYGNDVGFLNGNGLSSISGNNIELKKSDSLTIAHCYDLFKTGDWNKFQRYAFENKIIQPFKQIFRELYIINEDEKQEKTISRRYAGHQVNPQRTVALLKGRGWTVDYETGLQKVYHKEGIIAKIYALADWFSPADIEAPTIETVEFFGKKDYNPVVFEKIKPIVFSETMRDVDLVVSVAHVGGVDPMASHSTIEMRGVIVGELMNMLKITNVSMSGNHAKIKGSLGEYSVHLGSAIAHQMGRGALNIIPVHSQHRGRIFLPFIDEDPKTAEILAKILLLAEDDKIKDPTVLAQIK